MTTIIILEGIPTCGKTTVMNRLKSHYESKEKKVVTVNLESVHKRADLELLHNAADRIEGILQKELEEKPDYLVIENGHIFFLASNCMSKVEDKMQDYKIIEDLFKKHNTLIVYLEVIGKYILPNFRKTVARLKESHGDCFLDEVLQAKGSGLQQMAYFQKKQELYEKAINESDLNDMKIKISKETNYDETTQEIITKISQLEGFFSLAS